MYIAADQDSCCLRERGAVDESWDDTFEFTIVPIVNELVRSLLATEETVLMLLLHVCEDFIVSIESLPAKPVPNTHRQQRAVQTD